MSGIGRRKFLEWVGTLGLLYTGGSCRNGILSLIGEGPQNAKHDEDHERTVNHVRSAFVGAGTLGTELANRLRKSALDTDVHYS